MRPVERIHHRLAPLRKSLLEHGVYRRIDSLRSLQTFMQYHVYAVWDFMSLLKALQQRLCNTHVPWLPPQDPQSCRLINEIVLAEESDEDGTEGFASHFDLYYRAMQTCGARTAEIDKFFEQLRAGQNVRQALAIAEVPSPIQNFVLQTFAGIERNDVCAIASAFTFGREDLLPDVFQQIVEQISLDSPHDLSQFKYYLHRHIDLDGDQHGPMAARLIESLCGNSEEKWQIAEDAAVQALESRLSLWNGIEEAIVRD